MTNLPTLDDEIALLDFLFAETGKQLKEKGHEWTRWQQMTLINSIVRSKFPECLAQKIETLKPPIPSQLNPETGHA